MSTHTRRLQAVERRRRREGRAVVVADVRRLTPAEAEQRIADAERAAAPNGLVIVVDYKPMEGKT